MNLFLLDLYDQWYWERRRASLRQDPSVLAPPPPPSEGLPPPFTSFRYSQTSGATNRRPVQTRGFYSSMICSIRSLLDYLSRFFPLRWRFSPRRRMLNLWCPYCEIHVPLEAITETENEQLACPTCRFFLIEKERE